VTGASGSGNGQVQYVVTENAAQAERVGTLTVAGRTVTITQLAASYVAALTSLGIPDLAAPFRRPEATPSR
jgi:hypothetical protein